jgi:hypothetical protein
MGPPDNHPRRSPGRFPVTATIEQDVASSVPEQDVASSVPELDGESPDTVRLAELLSIAVRVEPALLRAVRRRLCPRLPAAAEADLWFSGLTDARNRTGFTLVPQVRAALQQRLAGNPHDLDAAWQVTAAIHAGAPQLMRFEEELVWQALSGAPDELLADRLNAVIAAMWGEEDRGRGLAQWAMRALPRLPPRLRELEQVWMLAFAGSARLGGRRILTGSPPPSALRSWLPLVIPADTPHIAVSARLLPGALELSEPPADPTCVLEVPATDPIVVEVLLQGTSGQGHQVVLERGGRIVVDVPFDDIYLRTVSGEIFAVTAGESSGPGHRVQQALDFRDERQPLLHPPQPMFEEAMMMDVRLLDPPKRGRIF